MKILLINRLHYVGGGADRVYLNTGKLLKKNGIDVAFFSTKSVQNETNDFEDFFINPVQTRNTNLYNKIGASREYLYNSDTIFKLKQLIEVFKPDIAHVHLFYGGLSSSLLVALRNCQIPTVITIHDYRLLCPANAMIDNSANICEKCKGGKFYNCLLKRCSEGNIVQSSILMLEAYSRKYFFDPLYFVDHFIFVSNFSKNKHIEFDKRFQLKSTQLYNFSKSVDNIEFIRGDYFLFYGRLSREKGILTLINVMIKTNFKLIIAGDGPLKEEISKIASETKNISYVGFKDNADLEALIIGCSYVIVPSEWYENNPMTIIESFSLGKPVIGSDIGGITELVDSNRGFLFQHSSISSLLNTLNLADNLDDRNYSLIAQNSYNFANEKFNESDHFSRLSDIYNNVLLNAQKSDK